MNIYPVIVIYNKKCSDSYSCRNLLELGYAPIIVDNSTSDYGNAKYCAENGMRYISMLGNAGLPKAYNAALDAIKSTDDGNGLVLWLDDDTEIGRDYFEELSDAVTSHPEADIFVPMVYSIYKPGKIISPCVPHESELLTFHEISEAEFRALALFNGRIEKTEVCTAINSGMSVRLKLYDGYRYDEKLFLDYVDHDFMYTMLHNGVKTYVLRHACIYQHFSGHNRWIDNFSSKKRKKIFDKDFKYYLGKTEVTEGSISRYRFNDFFRRIRARLYSRIETNHVKKVYRDIKHWLGHTDIATRDYIVSVDDYAIISNYMLADIETAEHIFLMRSNRIKDLPYFVFSRIKSWHLNRILKDIKYVQGRVLLTNDVLQYVSVDLLNTMKRNGCSIILLLIDPMSADYPSIAAAKEALNLFEFDKVFTFDRADANRYGFKYVNTLYSVPAPIKSDASIECDLFYCGNVKDRKEIIEGLDGISKENNFKIQFLVPGYGADRYIPYEEVADKLQYSNCILDLTQEGQSGITLRYYEAVVYNRKLLTNNRAITQLPFYNEKYMKIFDEISDIDWDWVKKREPIDYRYHGEFSPNHAGFFDD